MSRYKQHNSASIFLMELIISIFIFVVATAVCMEIFATAKSYSSEANKLDLAVSECSSVAEVVYSSNSLSGAINTLSELYPDAGRDGETITINLDSMTIKCGFEASDGMLSCTIEAVSEDESIYSLNAKHYVGKGA